MIRALAFMLLGLWVVLILEHAGDARTPLLVDAQLPRFADPNKQPHMLFAPCPVTDWTLPQTNEVDNT